MIHSKVAHKRGFFFLSLLLTFLLLFPKGGIKIAGVPITWGYLFLALYGLVLFIRSTYRIHPFSLVTVIALIPFQMVAGVTMMLNGVEDMGFAISFFLSFYLLPWLIFLILDEKMGEIPKDFLFSFLKKGIYFLAAYGIFLFFWKLCTGKFIEIPLITVNWGDWGDIDNKFINRGHIFKLISTYNNGNIFGICLLMFLPLYNLLEQSTLRKILVKCSLILTLSRTVWLGFLFSELLFLLFFEKSMRKKITYLGTLCFLVVIFGLYLNLVYGFSLSFLFDVSLGGRIYLIERALSESNFFSHIAFFPIEEVIYASIALLFGYFGLVFFLIAMTTPLLLSLFRRRKMEQKAIFLGLVTYLFISFSDGAILYIPVMAFYWFLTSLLWRDLSSFEKAPSHVERPPF